MTSSTERYVVSYSGGVSSWCATRRLLDGGVPQSDVALVFADTKYESDGLYTFLVASVAQLGCKLVTISDGRTPWEVFRDEKFIGNTRVDICSRVLKRDLLDRWCREHTPDATRVVGLDWSEDHRLRRLQAALDPVKVIAPLSERPWMSKSKQIELAEAAGLPVSEAYRLGYGHDNCGGRCVKAGHAHWAHLLKTDRCAYLGAEADEEATRQVIGKDVAILRDRTEGDTKPMTLREFRERIEGGETMQHELWEWGGCGCGV